MTIKSRLQRLEKRQPPARDTTDYETLKAGIIAKLEAVARGEPLPVQPTDPVTEALRAEIARRLDRIAEAKQ